MSPRFRPSSTEVRNEPASSTPAATKTAKPPCSATRRSTASTISKSSTMTQSRSASRASRRCSSIASTRSPQTSRRPTSSSPAAKASPTSASRGSRSLPTRRRFRAPLQPPRPPITPALPDATKALVVRTKVAGDFSPYTLRLVNDAAAGRGRPLRSHRNPRRLRSGAFAQVEFSFKVECPPDFDCAASSPDCPPDLPDPPPINYLAKDYGSFRTVLLDRLNQLLPGWGAATEADHGRRPGRARRLCRRLPQLSAGRCRHRGLYRDRAQPHLAAPSRAARRLSDP